MRYLIIISLLVALNEAGAGPLSSCADLVRPNTELSLAHFVKNLELKGLLQSPVLRRYERSEDPGFIEAKAAISSCDSHCKLEIDGESFQFQGSIFVDSETLKIQIDSILLRDRVTGQTYPLTVRPHGLDTTFVNFLGAIIGGIDEHLQKWPQITKLEIVANQVVNKPLLQVLQSLGFEKRLSLREKLLSPFSMGVEPPRRWVLEVDLKP